MVDPIDDPLLAELRSLTDEADPVPASVLAAAKAAFGWRTIDAELAELVADSLLAVGGVRANDAARLLTFRGADLEVEVEVEVEVAESGALRRLTGQLVPVGSADVIVSWATGSVRVSADDLGRFVVDGLPQASVRIEVRRPADDRPVVTSWVSI